MALDQFDDVLAKATFALGLLVNQVSGDFELVELQPVSAALAESCTARGLEFGGVIGRTFTGKAVVRLTVQLDDETFAPIAKEFARRAVRATAHSKWLAAPDRNRN